MFVVNPSSFGMKTDLSFLPFSIEMSTIETTDTRHEERTGCMRIPYVSENKGVVLLIVNCIFPGISFRELSPRTWNDDRSLLRKRH